LESQNMTISEQLIEKVLNTRFEDIDERIIAKTKDHIIEATGCAIAGANAPGSAMVVDLVKEWGGTKESTIFVHGVRAPANSVAMANAVMTRSHDFEPGGPYYEGRLMAGHTSGTTVPAAFAAAEKAKRGGKDLITALVAGNDFAIRILAASDYSQATGWDNTGTVTAFGATAVASKLLGLTGDQMRNALGIVINQIGGLIQIVYDANHSFKLPQGLAARSGIMSAELARHGFLGVQDFLSGYFSQFCANSRPNPENALKNLKTEYFTDGVSKPYPCCRLLAGPIECAIDLVKNTEINSSDIDEILVNSPNIHGPGVKWMTFMSQPFIPGAVPEVQASFSLVYQVANALVRKHPRLEHLSEEALHDPQVLELSKRVKLSSEPVLGDNQTAGMLVRMKNGDAYTSFCDVPRGDPSVHPLSKDELMDKFWSNVAFSNTVELEKVKKALEMLEKLEHIKSIEEVTSNLVC
jgi:2-methylcitrate dehydratase PrpD